MDKVIIAMHGLGNKPPENVYHKWWKNSILDGLSSIGKRREDINFQLVYWADVLNPVPQNPFEADRSNPYYIKEPYVPAGRKNLSCEASRIPKALDRLKREMKSVIYTATSFINIDLISDSFMKHWFKEINAYYEAKFVTDCGLEKSVKELINDRLVKVIYENRHKKILLAAHSMGALIAYDVLMNLPSDIAIDTFVTMGSPLGVPSLIKKLASEKGLSSIENMATPESVASAWYNVLDEHDSITLNHRLRDYYGINKVNVRVTDIVANNNYRHNGLKNPHKAFGYLACPEFANIINGFLKPEGSFIERLVEMLVRYLRISE